MPGDRKLTTAGAILEAALQKQRPEDRRADFEADPGARGMTGGDEVEDLVASVFSAVLSIDSVPRDTSFAALGGDSLMAISILSRIWRAFELKLPTRTVVPDGSVATVAEEVRRLRRAGLPAGATVPRRATAGRERAAENQAAIWFMESAQDAGPLYNTPYALRLEGPLDVEALKGSLHRLVQRHEALRLRFAPDDNGRLQQEPVDLDRLELAVVDVSGLPSAAREPRALELGNDHVRTPIDVESPPLIKPLLIKLGQADHLLVLALHHIVCDGWSIKLMMRDLADGYGSPGGEESPSDVPDFLDFIAWQRSMLDGEEGNRLIRHWRATLSDLDMTPLPTDYPRGIAASQAGEVEPIELDERLVGDLRRVAGDQGMTLYMVLLSAYALALSSCLDRQEVTVGSPVANREQALMEEVVGHVYNMLPMRVGLAGSPTLRELFSRVRATALSAYEHQGMPFARLVREIDLERHIGSNPVFQAGLVLNNMTPPAIDSLRLSEVILHTGTSKLDLTCYLEERGGGGLVGYLEYASALYAAETARRIRTAFERALAEIAVYVDQPLSEIRRRILATGDDPHQAG